VIQLSNISDKEVQLGKQINQQLVGRVSLYRNQEINRYVEQIGQRQTAIAPGIPYTFQVVDDEAVNAFATMGALSMSTPAC